MRSVKSLQVKENLNVKVKRKTRGVRASMIDRNGGSRVAKNTVVLWKYEFRGDLDMSYQALLEDKQRAKFGVVIGHQFVLCFHPSLGIYLINSVT